MKKLKSDECTSCRELEQIPNIGPALAQDLGTIGITRPAQLVGRDPYVMYDELCRKTAYRHDPCVLDTFIAAVRFMEGAPKQPWWAYTAERKRTLNERKRAQVGKLAKDTQAVIHESGHRR
jgi:hypothetical protein